MIRYKTAILLTLIQCVLVLTIAGKYAYERKVCPRVWTRSANVDPNSPLRGRYLVLSPEIDACGLKAGEGPNRGDSNGRPGSDPQAIQVQPPQFHYWRAKVIARQGKLVAVEMPDSTPSSTLVNVFQEKNKPCDRASIQSGIDYYIPDTAKWPPELGAHDSLWIEVTVPPAGPPRPIQLAVSRNGVFTPMPMN